MTRDQLLAAERSSLTGLADDADLSIESWQAMDPRQRAGRGASAMPRLRPVTTTARLLSV